MKKLLADQCQDELLGAHSCKRLQWCIRVQAACVYSWCAGAAPGPGCLWQWALIMGRGNRWCPCSKALPLHLVATKTAWVDVSLRVMHRGFDRPQGLCLYGSEAQTSGAARSALGVCARAHGVPLRPYMHVCVLQVVAQAHCHARGSTPWAATGSMQRLHT